MEKTHQPEGPSLFQLGRPAWLLLLLGLCLRCVALNQPLLNAHLIRQCQTAAATKSLIEEPGFNLSTWVQWSGDIKARYVLEFPLYNYLVIVVHLIIGNLDLSGKLISLLLWGGSFVVLQFIWRRSLKAREAFWANVLVVISPLGIFFGQAFMPETLIQFLAFSFILLCLRYAETPTLFRWVLCCLAGLAALLIKLPEVAHLYLVLLLLLWGGKGWKELLRIRYFAGAIVTVAMLFFWGHYTDSVNSAFLPQWTSGSNLRGFIGPLAGRLHSKPWAMIVAYLWIFVAPGSALLLAIYGFAVFIREQAKTILLPWLLSLAAFYLLWFGNGATGQSYYNLPALAPACALFGIGMVALLQKSWFQRWFGAAAVILVLSVSLPALAATTYLFSQDRQILRAAEWIRGHTGTTDVIVFIPGHRWDMIDYPYNPTLAYYGRRATFVCPENSPDSVWRQTGDRSQFAIVTLPLPSSSHLVSFLKRLRGGDTPGSPPLDRLKESRFVSVEKEDCFAAFRKE